MTTQRANSENNGVNYAVRKGVYDTAKELAQNNGKNLRAMNVINSYVASPRFSAARDAYGPAAGKALERALPTMIEEGSLHLDENRNLSLA